MKVAEINIACKIKSYVKKPMFSWSRKPKGIALECPHGEEADTLAVFRTGRHPFEWSMIKAPSHKHNLAKSGQCEANTCSLNTHNSADPVWSKGKF